MSPGLQGYRRPNYKELATDQARYQRWLLKHECKAFYTPVFAEDLKQGTQYLLQVGSFPRPAGWVPVEERWEFSGV